MILYRKMSSSRSINEHFYGDKLFSKCKTCEEIQNKFIHEDAQPNEFNVWNYNHDFLAKYKRSRSGSGSRSRSGSRKRIKISDRNSKRMRGGRRSRRSRKN